MVCTAGTKLIPIIQHTELTAFVARVWTAQWRLPVLSLCVWGAPFSDDSEGTYNICKVRKVMTVIYK